MKAKSVNFLLTGSFIGTVNLDFGTIDVASSSEANLSSGIVVTELETDAAL